MTTPVEAEPSVQGLMALVKELSYFRSDKPLAEQCEEARAYAESLEASRIAPEGQAAPSTTDGFAAWVLNEVHRRGGSPIALSLAAQLFGVGPCEHCGYRKLHCRCEAAPQAVPAQAEMTDALHAAIMNLPCNVPAGYPFGSELCVGVYRQGHRDARHAAAELVSARKETP